MAENKIHKIKSGKRERISFEKKEEIIQLPYFLEMQHDSYNKFLNEGIKKVLQEWSRIEDYSKKAELQLLDFYFDGEPKLTQSECRVRSQTYSIPLKVKTRLTIKETGQVVDQDVFLADIPLMTEDGHFIIDGIKRVIIGRIVRASGVYCSNEIDKTGKELYRCKVRPERGAWIEIEQTSADLLKVIVDKQSKMSLGILLKSLGLGSDKDILKIFGDNWLIKNTLEKEPQKENDEILLELAKKLRPGDIPSIEQASRYINELFYSQARYDMQEVGRFQYDKKLSVAVRSAGQMLSRDVVSPDGEILGKEGSVLTRAQTENMQNSGVNEIWIKLADGREHKIIGNNRVDIYAYTGYTFADLKINPKLKVYYPELIRILIENKSKEKRIKAIKENVKSLVNVSLTIDDLIAIVACILDLNENIGMVDEDDHLGNKRIKPVGETMCDFFRNGVIALDKHVKEKMQVQDFKEAINPSDLVSARPINNLMKEFTQRSTLSAYMDDVNPVSMLGNKRKITSTGSGGINKDRAGVEVRDINYTQYGRICPIETPEGENIGLVLNLANHTKLDEFGFLVTPYRVIDKVKGVVTDKIVHLTADEEDGYNICQATEPLTKEGKFVKKHITVRFKSEINEIEASQVDYMDASPYQFISPVTSLVPFVENDNSKRALMACNMQRQAVPLIKNEAPIVATGFERKIAKDSGVLVIAKNSGKVSYVDANTIKIVTNSGKTDEYNLVKFEKSNTETCINQKPIVKKGESVKEGDIIADGYSTDMGELALGKNILVGFLNWEGYNYEDAILVSERIVKEDVFTSIVISQLSIDASTTKLGDEEITRDIPNISEEALKNLDENGIVRIGTTVETGDILVGKVAPKGETELTPEERLLRAIFDEKAREVKDKSLTVGHGEGGVVVNIVALDRKNKDGGDNGLGNGINKRVKVYIAQKRKLKVGDKMAGRHGNKGVVSIILPEADMPYMADGTPIDILLNPLGVPARMNIGQVLEMHFGLVAKSLGWHVETPPFNGATENDIEKLLKENNLPVDGKMQLYDGRTGEAFHNKTTVGYMYILKLSHMVDSKFHARSTGPYVLVTQQPIGGKAKHGGQRFGEMEVWALEAYGAANVLQEMLTIKSDDAIGRNKVIESIVQGTPMGEPGIPEGFKVLVKEMQGLGLDVKVLTEDKKEINITELSELDSEQHTEVKQEEDLINVEIYDNTDSKELSKILAEDLNEELFDSSALFENIDSDFDE